VAIRRSILESMKPLAAVAVAAVLGASAAAFAAVRVHWPRWAAAALGAVLVAAAPVGKKTIDVLSTRLAAPAEAQERRERTRRSILGSAKRVVESGDRMELDVHPAIPLPRDAEPSLSPVFPEYIARAIDADLRAWIRARKEIGGLVVLVGDAAAGKTRCLYEALCAEVPDWRMPQVDNGAQINELVRERVDLTRTVLWLDDIQNFFTDEPVTAGSIRQLVTGRLGPVLLAATIRADELERLESKSAREATTGAADQRHASEVIRMLAHWSADSRGGQPALRFHLDSSLDAEELARARRLAALDPRLLAALRDADAGNVIETLAGAQKLIDRWMQDSGDRAGRAVVTAAVTARRCGHPEPIPAEVLEALALSHLAWQGHVPEATDWAQAAIEWAKDTVTGKIAALRSAVTTPGVIDGYQVSDILLQHSYLPENTSVPPMLEDEGTWTLLLARALPRARNGIGVAAEAAGRTTIARQAWLAAAGSGDLRAMRLLGWSHMGGDLTQAVHWFQAAVDLGDDEAVVGLAESLGRSGDFDGEGRWLRHGAERGNPGAMVNLGIRLSSEGLLDEAEKWYRSAAELGESVAMANLGFLFETRRGDLVAAEQWNRQGAELGHPGAMENLARLLKQRGRLDEAVEWYRKAADQGLSRINAQPRSFQPWPGEAADDGISNAILGFAEILAETGARDEAESWFRSIAEPGDSRAASALAKIHADRGDAAGAAEWRRTAAELADALLTRSKRTLRLAYGEAGVLIHIGIIMDYVDDLEAEGDVTATELWRLRASRHTLGKSA